MRYHSTRGLTPDVLAADALLLGAAKDGGLFVPDSLPDLSHLMEMDLSYQGMASEIFAAFFPEFSLQALDLAAQAAYGPNFDDKGIAPMRQVGDVHVLELFHGPTAAFKDLALQALPQLLSLARDQLDEKTRYLLLTATSGDTGSAAMRGFADLPGFHVLVYYPRDGVSAVQEAQMTRMPGDNVKAIAIKGNFDDAQAAVKAAFALLPEELPPRLKLTSANSINIGRLLPQTVYYLSACRHLFKKGVLAPGQKADFVVPSGNFGDIMAGFLAKQMGWPIGQLICATNRNQVLYDFIKTGVYDSRRELHQTLSPSMDILVSSNLERLLYYASSRDTDKVAQMMQTHKEQGVYQADEGMMARIRADFDADTFSDEEVLKAIREVWDSHRYLIDPHTATAWLASQGQKGSNPRVVLSTASPFKFPEAMLKALGQNAQSGAARQLDALCAYTGLLLPKSLQAVLEQTERQSEVIAKEELKNDMKRRAFLWS